MKSHPESYRFHRMYANLPINLRSEIVAVVDGEPMTFRVIHRELGANTDVGYEALDSMLSMDLIPE